MEPFEIEARLAIMDLVARYNRAGDTGRSEDFKEIFTGSGVFEMNGGRTAQGGQAIDALMEDMKRQFATAPAIFFPARHHVSGLTIDFADSDHATGREGRESFDHARTVAFDYMASVVSSFEEEGYEFLGDWKIQDELTVAHDLTYESNTLFPESEMLINEIVSEISSHTHPVELWLEHTRTGTTVVGVIGGLHQGGLFTLNVLQRPVRRDHSGDRRIGGEGSYALAIPTSAKRRLFIAKDTGRVRRKPRSTRCPLSITLDLRVHRRLGIDRGVRSLSCPISSAW